MTAKRKPNGNLRLEASLAGKLSAEDSEEFNALWQKNRSYTPLDVALASAAEGDLDELRRLLVKTIGDERVGRFVNFPKGERGKKLQRELSEMVGVEEASPTFIQKVTHIARRINRLFQTDYPIQWRRQNGVTWSAAYFAVRYYCRDEDGHLPTDELLEGLERSVEGRMKQSNRKR